MLEIQLEYMKVYRVMLVRTYNM